LIGIIVFIESGDPILTIAAFFIVAAAGIQPKSILKLTISVFSLVLLLPMCLALSGIIPDGIWERQRSDGTVVVRHLLGFLHPNAIGSYLFTICLSIFLLFGYRRLASLLFIVPSFFFLFFVVNSQTGSAILLILIAIIVVTHFFDNSKIILSASIATIFISVAVSFILPYFYSQNLIPKEFNSLLSGRIGYSAYFMKSYPITLFGQHVELVPTLIANNTGQTPMVLDNSFVHLLIHYGIIPFVFVLFCYISLLVKAYNTKNLSLVIAVAIVFFAGIAEKWVFIIGVNPVFILLFAQLQTNRLSTYQCSDNMFLNEHLNGRTALFGRFGSSPTSQFTGHNSHL
jgi:hypothetical protein